MIQNLVVIDKHADQRRLKQITGGDLRRLARMLLEVRVN